MLLKIGKRTKKRALKKRIEHEKAACKRAEEREKRYEEGRQNRGVDVAADIKDLAGGPVSDAIEAGADWSSIGKGVGYWNAEVPSCATLLNPESQKPKFDFFKK